jgi:hypothetical protein
MKIPRIKNSVIMLALFWLFVFVLYWFQVLLTLHFPQWSGQAYTMSHAMFMCGTLYLVLKLLFWDIKITDILKQNPIAYAVFAFCFAYLIGQAML